VKLRGTYFQNSLTPIALLSMFYLKIFSLYTEQVCEDWVSPKKLTWVIMEMAMPAIVSFSEMPGEILQYVRVPSSKRRRSLEVVTDIY
jgi:hypothetical protein